MNTVTKSILATMLVFSFVSTSFAQERVKNIQISKEFDVPAHQIWAIIGEDYGAVANSHPKIIKSEYLNGTLKGGEGAQRICYFNEKGTQFLQEKMLEYNPEEMSFVNQVFQAGKFPLDPESTRALYKIEDIGNGRSRVSFDLQYRTKPAMLGGMMKGSFIKLTEDYFIALEHYAKTGEPVNQENFKEIKKMASQP